MRTNKHPTAEGGKALAKAGGIWDHVIIIADASVLRPCTRLAAHTVITFGRVDVIFLDEREKINAEISAREVNRRKSTSVITFGRVDAIFG